MGSNLCGQLGANNSKDSCVPSPANPQDIPFIAVSSGGSHNAAISSDGHVYFWGCVQSSGHPLSGVAPEIGSIEQSAVPRLLPVDDYFDRDARFVSICVGHDHIIAVSERGKLYCCGCGGKGQVGIHLFGVCDLFSLTNVGSVDGRVVDIAAGLAHSISLSEDGTLYSWGYNRYGQLGYPNVPSLDYPPFVSRPREITFEQKVTSIAAGGHHSMFITVSGALFAFGSNTKGQLGTGDTVDRERPTKIALARVMQVQCGRAHTIVLLQHRGRNTVCTSGDNSYGQLGHGDRVDRNRFTPIQIASIDCVVAGCWHTAAVADDGELYTWGRGDCGQLGHGDNRDCPVPTKVESLRVC